MNTSMTESRRAKPDGRDLTARILDAARLLVLRQGARRLSLTEVATLAGVSRPTLYRYFQSKEDLIDALGKREYRRFNSAMHEAVSGLSGRQRLEAAIDVVAEFLQEQPPRHLVDLEPGFVNEQMAQVLPMMTDALVGVLNRGFADPRDLAGAIARTALSHYIFPDKDVHAARRQIRAAAGLPAS
jgi:TetR/AcrR family transcriptional regulator, repressor for uid operon